MDLKLYRAFNNIDPFEDVRFDTVIASLTKVIAQAHGVKGSKIDDWMIDWDPQPDTEQEKLQKKRNLAAKVMAGFARFFKKPDKEKK